MTRTVPIPVFDIHNNNIIGQAFLQDTIYDDQIRKLQEEINRLNMEMRRSTERICRSIAEKLEEVANIYIDEDELLQFLSSNQKGITNV